MNTITKAIIPLAGLGTRYLPLSKVIPKEFFPLADKPLIQYALEELKASGVTEVIFVVHTNRKFIAEYLKKSPQLEKILEEGKQDSLLEDLRELEKMSEGVTFSYVLDKPLGDGHAVLQARRVLGDEPCFVIYPDDIIEAKTPCALQLAQVFRTSQKPVIALSQLSREKLSSYGIVGVEKIAHKLYKIKKIIEKPLKETVPSNLAIVGRSILTPEVFEYLKRARPNKKGEISLSETLGDMVKDGKIVYGYEFEGRWVECGTKEKWMHSFVYFAARHPKFGKGIRSFLKEEKLL
ncbi:MAG: UTP--glucose-1-phosphate uridylyltransferase [Patescibacteria group bacterium]